jgi:hypothetical protein
VKQSKANIERTLLLLKLLRDPRMPPFGGFEIPGGRGKGMGRFLLGLTVTGLKLNGRMVISNGVY